MRPVRIISGGQTGADRAALDVAIELDIPHGGAVPEGRKAEDGPIPARYEVTEFPGDDYDYRTRRNVQAADATLIISLGPLTGGSALTHSLARRFSKPVVHVDGSICSLDVAVRTIRDWLSRIHPAILNVAGPRESTSPGIYAYAMEVLRAAFAPGEA